jgi:hypothetical protein
MMPLGLYLMVKAIPGCVSFSGFRNIISGARKRLLNTLVNHISFSSFPECVRRLYLKADWRSRYGGLVFEEMRHVKHNCFSGEMLRCIAGVSRRMPGQWKEI